MSDLEARTALVTGGARGIGRATAVALAEDGWVVAVQHRGRSEAAEALCRRIEEAGGVARALRYDVGQLDDIQVLFEEIAASMPPLGAVVACEGIAPMRLHTEVEPDEFDEVFNLNVRGTFFVLREAASRVEDGGRIVALTTSQHLVPQAGGGLYQASRVAVEQIVRCLAQEVGPRRVTVNAVAPGVTRGDGMELPAPMLEELAGGTPLGRLGEPDDVAEVIRWLCTDAAEWMTGQVVRPTGGLV